MDSHLTSDQPVKAVDVGTKIIKKKKKKVLKVSSDDIPIPAIENDVDEYSEFRKAVYQAIVKVHVNSQDYSYTQPWIKKQISQSSGSAVVILCKGKKLALTAAHVVANATYVQVSRVHNPEKFGASVFAVCHEADLALLEPEDPTLFQEVLPIEIDTLPRLRDRISVAGFPIGGEELSFTEGVVSRIEVQDYSHSKRGLLAITVDAAINSGNSGGPAFRGTKLVGIAFQAMEDAENIGELVSTTIVNHFLKSIEDGLPLDFPAFGVRFQEIHSSYLKLQLGMLPEQTGMLITNIGYQSTCWGSLEKGDVVLEIEKKQIAGNGSVEYRGFRTNFVVLLHEKFIGEPIRLKIIRNKKEMKIKIPAAKPSRLLVPPAQYDVQPFDDAPKDLIDLFVNGLPTPDRTEVVVLSQVLTSKVNAGYDFADIPVLSVNGKKFTNIRELVYLLESADSDMVEIATYYGDKIVLPSRTQEITKHETKKILDIYRVPKDRSNDLDDVSDVSEKFVLEEEEEE